MDDARHGRIGILGGTFNPVHLGHLILAQEAAETHGLAAVLFVPCAAPPHKETAGLTPAEHRKAMLEAAVADNDAFEVCDLELRRGGPSYSVDTVRELRRLHPGAALHFIIGADTLPELPSWRSIYELLELCRFVAFGRPGAGEAAPGPAAIRLRPPWPERLLGDFTPGRTVDISSSDIRRRVAEGRSIRYLVPEAVEQYIARHRLYGGPDRGPRKAGETSLPH
jgi:nicotinate-nucleotide adenylyltransferase